MPTASQHQAKAANNRAFLATIAVDQFPDWAVTVAFYVAVHSIERLRAAHGDGHSKNHEDRLAYVQHRWPAVHTDYHILQNVSVLARYGSVSDFFAQFQPEDVTTQIIGTRLANVESFVTANLVPSGAGP